MDYSDEDLHDMWSDRPKFEPAGVMECFCTQELWFRLRDLQAHNHEVECPTCGRVYRMEFSEEESPVR